MASPGQIKKIHALTGAMGMEDAEYRKLLSDPPYKVTSSKKLSIAKADDLIADLEEKAVAMGVWEKRKPGRKAKAKALDDDPQVRKIRQLWIELAQAGKVRNASEAAMNKYVQRMTGVAHAKWLDVAQASTVIEALKKWLARPVKEAV